MSVLLSRLQDPKWRTSSLDPWDLAHSAEMENPRLSHSFIAGLLVLASLPLDGEYVGIVALARMLDMSPSTTHRYVTTLVTVGLVERDPSTRGYRLARAVRRTADDE
jgi:DNA-binding MarR family transcriptional regulator